MGFSQNQNKALKAKLSATHVRTRVKNGFTLSYVEGWHVIFEANRIFGFDGWDRETVDSSCIWKGNRSGRAVCSYMARVRIQVRAGDNLVIREGTGAGGPPPPSWSTVIVRKRRIRDGEQTTQTGRDRCEVAAG